MGARRPIKVTATLAEPIVYFGDGLHLDGLVAYGRFRQMQRTGEADDLPDPQHADWPIDFDLPLARWEADLSGQCHARLLDDGRLWGWRASDAQWGEYTESSHALRKMPDGDQFVRHTEDATYKTSTGSLKAKDKTYPTRFAHTVEWWAVGDIDEVRECLREVTHLGKLRHHGMGRVQSWSVEAADTDRSLVGDGELMRRMPATWADSDRAPIAGTIRAPYWHPSREVAKTYPAGTEVASAVE